MARQEWGEEMKKLVNIEEVWYDEKAEEGK